MLIKNRVFLVLPGDTAPVEFGCGVECPAELVDAATAAGAFLDDPSAAQAPAADTKASKKSAPASDPAPTSFDK